MAAPDTRPRMDGTGPRVDEDLCRSLASLDLSFADLERSSDQIILFGSRAAGLARSGSDWDLLVVGEGHSRHTPAIDLVWLPPQELATKAWLASELAGHVARWGDWIHGAPDWTASVTRSTAAADGKAHRVASRLAALERAWDLLPSAYRRKHHALVRRDLQRHAILARGEPVPPSPVLDDAWVAYVAPRDELLRLAQTARVCSAFFEDELAGFTHRQAVLP
jgi:Nucleotidyltransferase domain